MAPILRLALRTLVCLLLCSLVSTAPARTWLVRVDRTGDAPTIQAAIDSVAPGDSILVAPGTYTWSNQNSSDPYGMLHVVRGKTDFVLASQAGAAVTVLDAQFMGRVMFLAGYNYMVIEGFTIRNGRAPSLGNYCGGGIGAHLSYDIIRDCLFYNNEADNQGGGLWCGGVSSMTFENCRFYANRARLGAGVFFVNSSNSPTIRDCMIDNNDATEEGGGVFAYNNLLYFENTLIVRNTAVTGGGIRLLNNQPATFVGCTIAYNEAVAASGISLLDSDLTTLERCIVSNGRSGAAIDMANSSLAVGCSNIWGNLGGDALPAGTIDNGGNFSLDPLFCDPASKNFHLNGQSPCVAGNHPNGVDACGLIGARMVQCGSVAVERHTWGSVKALYQ